MLSNQIVRRERPCSSRGDLKGPRLPTVHYGGGAITGTLHVAQIERGRGRGRQAEGPGHLLRDKHLDLRPACLYNESVERSPDLEVHALARDTRDCCMA